MFKEKLVKEEKKLMIFIFFLVEKLILIFKLKLLLSVFIFKGDVFFVLCKVFFEVLWLDIIDNIDLFVCCGSSCVYGGRKKD